MSIGFAAVSPKHVDIVTGDTVTWTNDSLRIHTVTAEDESFNSGRLAASQTFSRRFATTGEVAYYCTLHPLIRGVAVAHDLLLDAPRLAAAPNTPFPLTGRASSALAPGTAVSIQSDTGAGFKAVASTTVGPGGAFSARLVAPANADYRAVAGVAASPPVALRVLDSRISLRSKRVRGRTILHAKVTPASRGGRVVLQLLLPERFGWWPVQRAKLDRTSSARFGFRTKRQLRARVRLTLPDGATALATSRTVGIGRRDVHSHRR